MYNVKKINKDYIYGKRKIYILYKKNGSWIIFQYIYMRKYI